MIQVDDFLDILFIRVGKKLNKSQKQLQKFKQTLRANWYDSKQSLLQMQEKACQQLKIPMRLIQTIKQQLRGQGKKIIRNQSLEVQKNIRTNIVNEFQKQQIKVDEKFFEPKAKSSRNGESLQQMMYKTISLSGKLMQQHNDDKKVYDILMRLKNILANINTNIYEMKYRFLKVNNPIIIEVICSNQCVVQFIQSVGFQRQQDAWFMAQPDIEALTFYQEAIRIQMENILAKKIGQAITNQINIQKSNGQPQLLTQNQLMSQYKRTLPNSRNQSQVLTKSNQNKRGNNANIGYQYQRSKQQQNQSIQIGYPIENSETQALFFEGSSKQINQTEVLQNLISFRSSCLAAPLQNRKERIYQRKNIYHAQTSQTCLKDLISYSCNPYKRYLDPQIQFYRKGELFALMNQIVYKQTCVRVQLPNDFIIEGWFGSCELLGNVLNWMKGIIQGDIYLYTVPPKKVMKVELNMALGALQAIPIGFFHLGINGKWLINTNYAGIIEK